MSRPFISVALLGLVQLFTHSACLAEDKEVWEEVAHNVRVMRHRDGTATEYRRSSDEKTLRKRRLSGVKGGRNSIITTTIYRMDKRGNPLSCKIFDGKENQLFKVAYGYHRETGQLVAEDMFDSRTPTIDPKTGEEVPIRRMYWFYDGSGNITKAFSFAWRKGSYAEDQFESPKQLPSSFPKDNPFRNAGASGTPAAPAAPTTPSAPGTPAPNTGTIDNYAVPPPLPPLPFEK